jgi:hypothetical protein
MSKQIQRADEHVRNPSSRMSRLSIALHGNESMHRLRIADIEIASSTAGSARRTGVLAALDKARLAIDRVFYSTDQRAS